MQDSVWFRTLGPEEQAECARADEVLPRPDLLILGGSLVGLATAYFAALAGMSVQVLAGLPLEETSGSLGGIWPNHEGNRLPEAFRDLASQSRDLWAKLAVRPEFKLDWRVNGFLDVSWPSAAEAEQGADAGLEQGLTVTAVDAGQIAGLEPALRPGLAGLHYPSDAHVHPLKARLSLARAARQAGARISDKSKAKATSNEAGGTDWIVNGVSIRGGTQAIDGNSWSREHPGLKQVTSHAIATAACAPVLKTTIQGDVTALQLRSGEVLICSPARPGKPAAPDSADWEALKASARTLIPALAEVEFPYQWKCMHNVTPDGLPIIERMPGDNAPWGITDPGPHGVLFAPLLGRLLAQSVSQGSSVADLQLFSSARFA